MGSVHIRRSPDVKVRLLARVAALFGTFTKKGRSYDPVFVEKIKKRQNDIDNGRSKTFTIDELDNL